MPDISGARPRHRPLRRSDPTRLAVEPRTSPSPSLPLSLFGNEFNIQTRRPKPNGKTTKSKARDTSLKALTFPAKDSGESVTTTSLCGNRRRPPPSDDNWTNCRQKNCLFSEKSESNLEYVYHSTFF